MTDQTVPENETKTEKAKSALTLLLESQKGAKKPNASDVKATTEKFKKMMGKRAELQKALDEHDAASDATAIDMVKCYGAKHVEIGGSRYVPTSRGTRVYYKRMSDEHDTVKLD